MPSDSMTIGFLGAGNMAEAILRGLIARGTDPGRLAIADVRAERTTALAEELKVTVAADNAALLRQSETVILGVKPQNAGDLLRALRGEARPEQLFVSILAGTRAETLEALLAHEGCRAPRVVRVMPNTPALLGAGASAISTGTHATQEDAALARTIFEAVGVAEILPETQMDAVTGLTGSGPAYFFRMIEAMIEAGVAQGLAREQAARLVKQTALGAARMAVESGEEPAELRRRVTSPGGTTAAGLAVLEEENFVDLILRTVDAATKRSAELGRQ